jgi:hypothetical protein
MFFFSLAFQRHLLSPSVRQFKRNFGRNARVRLTWIVDRINLCKFSKLRIRRNRGLAPFAPRAPTWELSGGPLCP